MQSGVGSIVGQIAGVKASVVIKVVKLTGVGVAGATIAQRGGVGVAAAPVAFVISVNGARLHSLGFIFAMIADAGEPKLFVFGT